MKKLYFILTFVLLTGIANAQDNQPPTQKTDPAREGQILRRVFFQSIALAILVGLLGLLQAYVLMRWVPK